MNFLNRKVKVLLSLVGIATNASALAQTPSASAQNQELGQFEQQQYSQISASQNYQIVSQDELLNALQNNKLEQLLLKKGILIQKPSADGTICKQTGTGDGG